MAVSTCLSSVTAYEHEWSDIPNADNLCWRRGRPYIADVGPVIRLCKSITCSSVIYILWAGIKVNGGSI